MKVIAWSTVLLCIYLTGDKFLTNGQKSRVLTFSWEKRVIVFIYNPVIFTFSHICYFSACAHSFIN
jgi:hypothetical protein